MEGGETISQKALASLDIVVEVKLNTAEYAH